MAESHWAADLEKAAHAYDSYREQLPEVPLSYTRTMLARNEDYEIVAMRWAPGSVSPIHDHGQSRCWALVLEGELFVENFERVDDGDERAPRVNPADARTMHVDEIDHRLNWHELHRVRNTAQTPAISLQLYAPALSEYFIFEEHGTRLWRAQAKYDATI